MDDQKLTGTLTLEEKLYIVQLKESNPSAHAPEILRLYQQKYNRDLSVRTTQKQIQARDEILEKACLANLDMENEVPFSKLTYEDKLEKEARLQAAVNEVKHYKTIGQAFSFRIIAEKHGVARTTLYDRIREGKDSGLLSDLPENHPLNNMIEDYTNSLMEQQYTEEELNKKNQEVLASLESINAQIFFEKTLTTSDVNGAGRVVIPKAVAELNFPLIPDSEKNAEVLCKDVYGQESTINLRYWINNSSRMYLLEGLQTIMERYDLRYADVMLFAKTPEGEYVFAGRKGSKDDLKKPKSRDPSAYAKMPKRPKDSTGGALNDRSQTKKSLIGKRKLADGSEPLLDGVFRSLPDPIQWQKNSIYNSNGVWIAIIDVLGELYQGCFETQQDAEDAFYASGLGIPNYAKFEDVLNFENPQPQPQAAQPQAAQPQVTPPQQQQQKTPTQIQQPTSPKTQAVAAEPQVQQQQVVNTVTEQQQDIPIEQATEAAPQTTVPENNIQMEVEEGNAMQVDEQTPFKENAEGIQTTQEQAQVSQPQGDDLGSQPQDMVAAEQALKSEPQQEQQAEQQAQLVQEDLQANPQPTEQKEDPVEPQQGDQPPTQPGQVQESKEDVEMQ